MMRILRVMGVMLIAIPSLVAVNLPEEWQAVFPEARLVETGPVREEELSYQFFLYKEGLSIHLRFSCASKLKFSSAVPSVFDWGTVLDPVCRVSFWSPKGETTVTLPYDVNDFMRVLGYISLSEVFILPNDPLYLEPGPMILGSMPKSVASRRVGGEVTSIVRPFGRSRAMDALMEDLWTDIYQKMEKLPEAERLPIARLIVPDGVIPN